MQSIDSFNNHRYRVEDPNFTALEAVLLAIHKKIRGMTVVANLRHIYLQNTELTDTNIYKLLQSSTIYNVHFSKNQF